MKKYVIPTLQGTICIILATFLLFLWKKGWTLALDLMKLLLYQKVALFMITSLIISILLLTFYILHLIKTIDKEKEKWKNPSVMHEDELLKRILKPCKKEEEKFKFDNKKKYLH